MIATKPTWPARVELYPQLSGGDEFGGSSRYGSAVGVGAVQPPGRQITCMVARCGT